MGIGLFDKQWLIKDFLAFQGCKDPDQVSIPQDPEGGILVLNKVIIRCDPGIVHEFSFI
jgi:hypothetical protein